MYRPSFRAASVVLAGILIAIGGCSEAPVSPARQFIPRATPARFDLSGSASAVIDESGGTLSTPQGDRITFPAGALPGATTVTITSDEDVVGVELQPHGITFPAGHEPVLSLNAAGTPPGLLRGAAVAYVDGGAIAEILPAAVGGARITTNLAHFSGYTAVSH